MLRCLPFCASFPAALLAQVSQYLERLTGDLEAAAHPALDALTGKASAASC